MSDFKKINPSAINESVFDLIGKDWALVTSGNSDKFNTMTTASGRYCVGCLLRLSLLIRPQRYTFEFIENNGYYTMSFFDEKYRDALKLCGSKSGRDIDKVAETGLTPAFTEDGIPYFAEAKLVLVCKKMYAQFLNGESIVDNDAVDKWYDNDFHKMYISEIVEVLTK